MKILEEVYADCAIDCECPNCHAAPNDWCHRPDGQTRRIPCIARVRLQERRTHNTERRNR
jgi:hypothetical protein